MDFEAVLFVENQIQWPKSSSIQSSIDWLLKKGFANYVKYISDKRLPINLLEVLKNNHLLDGNDLLTLFGHVENLNKSLSESSPNSNNRPQSTCATQWPSDPLNIKFIKNRWSCNLSSSIKPQQAGLNQNISPISIEESNTTDRLHTFKSTSFHQMNQRSTPSQRVCQNQHISKETNPNFHRETEFKSPDNTIDEPKNLIGCTKHRSLATVREQSVNDECTESTNHNYIINDHCSQFISLFSNSNSLSFLNSKQRSENNKDLPRTNLNFHISKLHDIHSLYQLETNTIMKSNVLTNVVPEILVASNSSETPKLSPENARKSSDSDYLQPISSNINLRVSNDIPRSTGSNRRFFNSWGYDFELDSGVEELSNDSIDMGEAGRINFRTGSFMTRYRRNSKLSNNTSSPRPEIVSPSQHCVNWAYCKDESCHSVVDNVDDELNPVLDSLFSDMDSLDNFRNILQNRRISNNFEDFNTKDTKRKDIRPNDLNTRKPSHINIEKSCLDQKIDDLINLENTNKTNNLNTRQTNENKFRKSSLKKSVSVRKRNHPFRWSSLARTNQPASSCGDVELSHLSLNQFLILKKLAMLRLTSLLELYIPSQKSQFNWKFPKLLSQKSKLVESTNEVFGSSLSYWQSKIGQPLPPVIYHALKHIRQVGPESDGIFRRAGGKARINELKKEIEKNPEITDFGKWQSYDVADMIKSYFRSLPECLLTNKFSSTLISIKTYIPEPHWFEAIQWVIINLPDENRLVLQSLLYFLSDLTKHSKTTQMTSYNLAVCLSPSLFHSPHVISSSSVSPMRMRKSTHGPDQRDLDDHQATHHCLKFMIDHAPSLFRLSQDTITKARIQMEFERTISLAKLLRDCNDWYSWMRSRIDKLMNEYTHKFKNWTTIRKDIFKIHNDKSDMYHGFELFYKKNSSTSDKSNEGINAIGTWRISADIDANHVVVLDKIQNKRHEWDPEIEIMSIKKEISDSVDVCYVEVASTPPQTKRKVTLIRGFQRNIDGNTNVLITQSVEDTMPLFEKKSFKHLTVGKPEIEHDNNVINVIQDDVIIEYFPATQKSRINWLSRVDLRGYSSEWYFRQWSHVLIRRLIHLKIACAQK